MSAATTRLCVSLLILFFALFAVAQIRIQNYRAQISHQLKVSAVPLPPELLKAFAGEFKGVVANYLLLEAASFIGGDRETGDQEWSTVAHLFEQSSVLDPYFKQTYSLVQGTLPWYAQRIEETLIILERSSTHRVWDWVPGFFIGFNHFYFHQDPSAASKALMEATKVPNAPPVLSTWAARLASQAGQHRTAIDFLVGMHDSTDDEQQRAMLRMRIEAVQGAYLLQQAVDRFNDQLGRLPSSLAELLERGFIAELPENPYGRPYTIENGKVEF